MDAVLAALILLASAASTIATSLIIGRLARREFVHWGALLILSTLLAYVAVIFLFAPPPRTAASIEGYVYRGEVAAEWSGAAATVTVPGNCSEGILVVMGRVGSMEDATGFAERYGFEARTGWYEASWSVVGGAVDARRPGEGREGGVVVSPFWVGVWVEVRGGENVTILVPGELEGGTAELYCTSQRG